jgi:hypothetical protein
MPSYTIEFENSKYDIGHKHLVTSTKNLRQIYLAAHTPFVVCLTKPYSKKQETRIGLASYFASVL